MVEESASEEELSCRSLRLSYSSSPFEATVALRMPVMTTL